MDKPGLLQCSGKQKKGVLEWEDAEGNVVAIETMAINRGSEEERFEILVQMGKMEMDLLVATWVARIHQDTQKEGRRRRRLKRRRRSRGRGILRRGDRNGFCMIVGCFPCF